MSVYVTVPKIGLSSLAFNADEGIGVIASAIIAGIILYFLNKSFLNNYPAYVAIILGFVLSVYLGNHFLADALGFTLMADGIYKLIKQYVSMSS